jgi:tRNA 2-selenouridine synthase SelU
MPFKLIVLKGLAGTSKTEVIKKLSASIDLEGLAMHRSSTFGAIGLNKACNQSDVNCAAYIGQKVIEEKITK